MTSDETFRKRAIYLLLAVTVLGCALTFLWIGRVIFLLLFASVIGAVFLDAIGHSLAKHLRIPRGLALALFLLAGLICAALAFWIQGPNVLQQFAQLQTDLPVAAHRILGQLQDHSWGRWLLSQAPDSDQISTGFRYALTRIGGIVLSSVTLLAGLAIVLSLSIYLASEPEIYFRGLRCLFPQEGRKTLDACAASARKTLLWWVLAKLLSMTIVGVLIGIGLWLIGVPLAGPLAIIAALMTFIPNVGPLISVLPAGLLGLAISPTTGLLTLLVFAVVFVLEGYLVTPLLERNIVRLPPALTLLVQLLLAAVAGPIGVALAAPIAAVGIAIASVLIEN